MSLPNLRAKEVTHKDWYTERSEGTTCIVTVTTTERIHMQYHTRLGKDACASALLLLSLYM